MAKRHPRSKTPLDHKQQELARLEDDLRRQVEDLERAIADAPRIAEERARRQREELLQRANEGRNRLDVSIPLQDKRYLDDSRGKRQRPRSLRKQRSEGRLLFLVLMLALAIAVVWLLTHLPL